MDKIIECVPNYSEGRNKEVIDLIVKAIADTTVNTERGEERVRVLDVDPGEATNRTVVTFVGSPEAVMEAAFQGEKKAAELIDMRQHHGAHPRSGATDVLPLIPVAGTTLDECAGWARTLAKRIYDELGIPCYCYEAAAYTPERRNLAVCRAGEYEALPEKVIDPKRKPDFGPGEYNETVAKAGATNVGARDFLIAVNFNLNTTSTRRAMAVAFDVREKGRPAREGGSLTGKILKDADGQTVWIPGTLKGCKAIGWYIEEYGIAQVSMNITDINTTPLHVAFEEVCRAAAARGLRVTGTEIVGLVPKRVLLETGRYYLEKQQRSLGISEDEIIKIAAKSLGLSDLKPFNPREKVIEFLMEDEAVMAEKERLIRMTLKGFARETASESAAPGGGSVSAYMGALAAALGAMVANLSAHKRGWDDRWKEFSDQAVKGQDIMERLLKLVDEDTAAFAKIMNVFSMPKGTEEEKAARAEAMEKATLYATQVPLRTMQTALEAMPLALEMARKGNPASASDAGVGAIAALAAVKGAQLNVRINAAGLKDRAMADSLTAEAEKIAKEAAEKEAEILSEVNKNIG
ncbi:MAG: glutamate formimidoyltransferase [Candidatus Cryptobacteroides sp.]|nr:glutamate formimidoyltransferase [Bacteroides sp.]MCI7662846.1 glutamate formimidoyltransferase [Bacteroides sp.]MDY5301577.1 glutamate formimidoyltransferase [Candidatus Cryptobacteroides sp.]